MANGSCYVGTSNNNSNSKDLMGGHELIGTFYQGNGKESELVLPPPTIRKRSSMDGARGRGRHHYYHHHL